MQPTTTYFDQLRQAGYYNQRMSRHEFWTFTLVNAMLTYLVHGIPVLNAAAFLVFLVLTGFAMCQRLNDAEISRKWLIMLFLPYVNVIGLFWLLIYMCQPSYPATNDHGPCRV